MSTWKRNYLTDRLGLDVPIIQAPMAGASTPELAAAVSRRGGLGSLGCAYQSLNKTWEDCEIIRSQTTGPFNLNFLVNKDPVIDEWRISALRKKLARYYTELGVGEVPRAVALSEPFNEKTLEVVLEIRPSVISFHYGLPKAELFCAIKEAGLFTISSATTVREAMIIEEYGFDAVIAQGYEAAGHRGTFDGAYEEGLVGTMALVPQITDTVAVPVIAAGGIMDGRGIAAALALGADAVQMGTAFLNCPESSISETYRNQLAKSRGEQTRLTSAFSGRLARGIENRFIKEMKESESDFPDFPIPHALTGPLRTASAMAGSPDFISLWAGQGCGMSRSMPAPDLMDMLIKETDEVLKKIG